jgi:hypothetical protein
VTRGSTISTLQGDYVKEDETGRTYITHGREIFVWKLKRRDHMGDFGMECGILLKMKGKRVQVFN